MTTEELWAMILRFLRFGARLPVAGLMIAVALLLSFSLGMIIFRATQWFWAHCLSKPR